MRTMFSGTRFGLLAGVAALGLAGCAGDDLVDPEGSDPDEIIGANAVGRNATIESYVLVGTNASESEIKRAMIQQLRPLFGAMKAQDIGLGNRLDGANATSFIDVSTWRRDTVDVIDPMRPETPVRQLQRVRFRYTDRAIVHNRFARRRAFPTTTLFGDYNSHASEIVQDCQSEHRDWGASGIWYNFEPHLSACQQRITAETARITAQRRRLEDADRQVTVDEAARWFTPISIKLTTISRQETRYPDYHRLFDDNRLVVYSFFGEDKHDDPNDYGARNFFAYLQTVLQARPELRVSAPGTDLTAVSFRGMNITGVTALQVAGWINNGTGYPSQVSFSDRNEFRRTVIRQWRDKTVTLSAPATVSINGASKMVTLEVRAYYGDEESFSSGAVSRYRQAFRDADVFQYTGHSHLGAGPLDSRNFSAMDFANQYQILQINSCVSFNYYNEYFTMHPGGTRNLDTVTNGLPVYLEGSGLSTARFTVAFLDGRFRSYNDILVAMRVNLGWEYNHDANRVADGESDNTFTPTSQRMTLTVAPAAR
jgi:hypothetical protein